MNFSMPAPRLAGLFVLVLGTSTAMAQHEHHLAQEPDKPVEEQHDHSTMDHSQHEGMDHAQHQASDAIPFPQPTLAERAAAFPNLGDMTMRDHGMDDDAIHAFLRFNEFGWRKGSQASAFAWNLDGWVGRDLHKLHFRSEGSREAGRTGDSNLELLYGHAISPWWDAVVGLRHEFRPAHSRSYLAVGVQGLAPYQFELHATAYIGESGHAFAKFSGEYEVLFTDKFILTPELGVTVNGKTNPERGLASGETALHAGLRLRYEFRPDIAPYIGYEHERSILRKGDSPQHGGGEWMAGIRFWF